MNEATKFGLTRIAEAADVDYEDAERWWGGRIPIPTTGRLTTDGLIYLAMVEEAEDLARSGQLNVTLMGPQLVNLGVNLDGVVR